MKRTKHKPSMRGDLAKPAYVGGYASDWLKARRIDRARRKEIARQIIKEET